MTLINIQKTLEDLIMNEKYFKFTVIQVFGQFDRFVHFLNLDNLKFYLKKHIRYEIQPFNLNEPGEKH